jgi:hypothetical protein
VHVLSRLPTIDEDLLIKPQKIKAALQSARL